MFPLISTRRILVRGEVPIGEYTFRQSSSGLGCTHDEVKLGQPHADHAVSDAFMAESVRRQFFPVPLAN